jgi:UDP-3-O-[3-hydroxymyristoyl] glucosamine N-acyltransferase
VREGLTLPEAARICGAELEGDADGVVTAVAPIECAGEGDLTFFDGRQDPRLLAATPARAVVVPTELFRSMRGRALLRSPAPHQACLAVSRELWMRRMAPPAGIASSAVVHPAASLADGIHVGAGCSVGAGARIGADAVLHPGAAVGEAAVVGAGSILQANVVVGPTARLGERCLVHAGAVIGFSYRPARPGGGGQAPPCGGARIGDDVEIGPGCVVEDGEERPTTIGDGVQLGAGVVVGHDCAIGAGARLVAMVGLAGGVEVGPDAMLFGQVGVGSNLRIGAGAIVDAKSGVTCDVPERARYRGSPARARATALELQAALKSLPELAARVQDLERALEPSQVRG